MRGRHWVPVGGIALVILAGGIAARLTPSSSNAACLETELPRTVSNGADIEQLPAADRGEIIAWASELAGYEVRLPCYLPDDLVMRGMSVNVSPVFEEYWGRRVEISASSKAEAGSQYITGPYMQIAQFPRQGEPEDMEPTSIGVGESAAWRREQTNIEPPESDLRSSSSAFYLVHKDTGTISVQITTSPGELPSEASVRRIIQSMFE